MTYQNSVFCRVCGIDVDNPPVPDENGHTYIEETTDPTCTEKGYTTHTCTICGDSYVDSYIDALGHDMTHSVTTKEPTCTQKGEETISCSRCDYSETRQLDALSHVVVTDETIAPSCTEDGLTEGSHCSRCGEILVERKVIPATGHIDENDDGNCDTCGSPIHSVTPENCSCRCHKKGFSGFIYKIMRIFWKIFRINKTCVCGEDHY